MKKLLIQANECTRMKQRNIYIRNKDFALFHNKSDFLDSVMTLEDIATYIKSPLKTNIGDFVKL